MSKGLERQRERAPVDAAETLSFEALEERYFLEGQWQQLVSLYERRLAAPALRSSPSRRARLLFRLGQVLEERCGDPDRALERYHEVARLDPTFRPALSQLRRLYSSRQQWELTLQVAELESGLDMQPFERATFHCELGDIWAERMGDTSQAMEHYERALEAVPEHVPAGIGRARALAALGWAREAEQAYSELLPRLQGTERAAILLAMARLLEGPLEQPDRAFDAYRRALTDDPRDRNALDALVGLATRREQWPMVAELQERRFEIAEDPEERLSIALQAGDLELRRLGNPHNARLWFGRACELAPDRVEVALALAEVERVAGNRHALGEHLEQAIVLDPQAVPAALLVEAASLASEQGDPERAVKHARAALEQAPDDPQVLGALAHHLAVAGHAEELALTLERQAALTPDAARRSQLLAELGRVYEDRIEDSDAALDAYRRAFEADPAQGEVGACVERLLRKAEAWSELREHLELAVSHGSPGSRPRLHCSLGWLLLERLEDLDGASRCFETALAEDARHEPALRGLERVALSRGDEDAILRVYEREVELTTDPARLAYVVREMVRLLEERDRPEEALLWAGRWAGAAPEDRSALETCARLQERLDDVFELATTLERLDALYAGEEQAANRRRLARVHADLGNREQAITWNQAALGVAPGNVEALEALIELLESAGRLGELAAAHRQLAAHTTPPRRTECLDALARLLADGMGDLDGAIEVLQSLAAQPGPPPDVDERLERLLDRRGRYEDLCSHLARRRDALDPDDPERQALDLRRAELLLDKLERWEEAIRLFREVLAHDPNCEAADRGLESALRSANDVRGLVDLLSLRVERAVQPVDRERLELERACLLEDALGDIEGANRAYLALADAASDPAVRDRATQRLEALLERGGEWAALRDRIEARLPRSEPPEARELHERLARLAADHLNEPDRAIHHLEEAGRLDPQRAAIWRRLALLYEAGERLEDLRRVLEAELATGPDPSRELALRARAATLYAARPDEAPQAETHYRRVLELCPSHADAAEFVVNRLEAQQRHAELVEVLEAQLAHLEQIRESGDAPSALSLRLRIAAIRSSPLGDPEGAVPVLEAALGEPAALSVVGEPLADLYDRTRRRDALIELCRRVVRACELPGERAEWYLRLGDALRDAGEDAQAAQAYHQALADRPGDPTASDALCNLYRRLGEADPLSRLLEAKLARVAGAAEIDLRLELAELLGGALRRPDEALQHLRRVLELDPGHAEALGNALALAECEGRFEQVLSLLDLKLRSTRSARDQAQAHARKGNLLLEALDRPEEAVAAYRNAVRLDGQCITARRGLRVALEKLGRAEELLDLLHLEAQDAEPETRVRLLEDAARIAADRLSLEAALPWLERLRTERPEDVSILVRIAEVHRRAGRPGALLRALDRQLALGLDPERRREVHLERAQLLEKDLGIPSAAIEALEAARGVAPDDPGILRDLERLYEATGRAPQRADVLEALVALVASHERNALRWTLAGLHAGPLRAPEAAARVLEEARAHPEEGDLPRAELLQALGTALGAAGRLADAARIAEQELDALDPESGLFAERRAQLHWDLARLYGRELANPVAELKHLRALVDGEGGRPADTTPDRLEQAEDALAERLRRDRNAVELAERLAARLVRRPDDAAGWFELAQLEDEQLHRPGRAARAYQEVLAREPGHLPALRGLRSASERLGDWPTVVETLEGELEQDLSLPPGRRAALLRRIGELAWKRLGSTTRASRAFAQALEAEPGDLRSLRALEQLFESVEDWRGALDLYESEVETLGDAEPARRQRVWLRVAELARDRTGDLPRALRAFEAAAQIGSLPAPDRREHAEAACAAGDPARFAEIFATWCDDEEAGARGEDHLRLALALEDLARGREALERIERSLDLDPGSATAWEGAARLRGAAGDGTGRVEALERAAELLPGPVAAQRLEQAAREIGPEDPRRAVGLLRRAVARDPSAVVAHAALARFADRARELPDAESAALRLLELGGATGQLETEVRVEVARIGARAARRMGHLESAAELFGLLLALEPDSPEALEGLSDILLQFGNLAEARRLLEHRLTLGGYPARARDLLRLGQCLEAQGMCDQALERYSQAIDADPTLLEAHQGRGRLLESCGRPGEALAAVQAEAKAWGARSREAARCLARAARMALEQTRDPETAERLLREVVELDPSLAEGWILLARKLASEDRVAESLDVALRGIDCVGPGGDRLELMLLRARALEAQGQRRPAADAYREAVKEDASQVDAGLASARLYRALGEWRAAAGILKQIADHSHGNPVRAASIFHQLGRLLAGPLEDVAGAIEAYHEALERHPEFDEAQQALADLLVHRPEHWAEAVERHARILTEHPQRLSSLRGLLRMASGRRDRPAEDAGLAILKAIGAATPEERERAGASVPLPRAEGLEDPLFECARRIARAASTEISQGLETSPPSSVPNSADPVARLRTDMLTCAAELSAPALVPLTTDQTRDVLCLVARLASDADSVTGDGHLVNALAGALGRRARRRVRRALGNRSPEEIAAIDFAAWRAELRALACAEALRRTGADLRTALLALLGDEEGGCPPEEADLGPRIVACPEARALLRRVVLAWIGMF